jgi:hypothetical protein
VQTRQRGEGGRVLLGVRLIRRIVDSVQLERDDLQMHVVLLSVRG